MWQILRRNPRAFGASLLLHLILAAFTLVGVDWLATFDDVRTEPRVIQASIVGAEVVEAKAAARRQAEAKRRVEEEARRRAEAERKAREAAQRQKEAKRRAEKEAKRRAEKEARQRAEAERKAKEAAQRQAEAKRRAEEEARQQAEAERKAKEAAQRQAEAKRKAEEEARRARETDLLAALDAEQAAAGELSLYTNAIRERIRRSWVRQPGMGRDLSCLVEVRLIPGGEVIPAGVRVIRSSGNLAFDRSVVAAVYKASPLPVPSGQLFGQFRNLRLDFKP